MTIPLTGAGSTPSRLGLFMGGGLDILAVLGGTPNARVLAGASWATRYANVLAAYAAGIADQAPVDGFLTALTSWQGSQNSFFGSIQRVLQQTLVDAVTADRGRVARPGQPALTWQQSLSYWATQMAGAGTSFNASAPSVGTQAAVGTPSGNPVLVASVKDGLGNSLQYVIPEKVSAACSRDSYSGGLIAGREQYAVSGQTASQSQWDYDWPRGSGGSLPTLNAVAGDADYPNGSLLVNGDFQVFTNANLPDNWAADSGTVGTDILNGTSANAYTTGGGSLQLKNGGAVYQPFNTPTSSGAGTGGTPFNPSARAPYAFSVWVKVDAVGATGVLQFALTDGTGAVINNDAGTPNSVTLDLATATATYANVKGVFTLPRVLPAAVRFRVKPTTNVSSGHGAYLGRLALAAMQPLYNGGPPFALFSGNAPALAGDTHTLDVANTYGVLQREMDRYFGLRDLGISFPGSGTPTVPDSVVG
jgi:hypothetical protein